MLHQHRSPLIITILSCTAGFFVYYSLTDADIFWHLASGREMYMQKHLLYHDPFAYTQTNPLWINCHWLFQLAVFTIYKIGGYRFLLLFKSLCITCATATLAITFTRSHRSLCPILFLVITLFFQRYLIPMRPILFSICAISLYLILYEQVIANGKYRWIFFIIVIQIIWVNSQGLFLIGPVIGCAYAIGEYLNHVLHNCFQQHIAYHPPKRHLLLLLILPFVLLLASLINPYGIHTIVFALKLFLRITPSASNNYSHMIPENMPLLSMVNSPYAYYPIIVIAVCCVLLFVVLLTGKKIRMSLCMLAAAGLILAFMAQRNGILFTFLAFPALLYHSLYINISSLPLIKMHVTGIRRISTAVIIIILLIVCVKHAHMLHIWPHSLSPFSFPTESVRYLNEHPRQGNLFNADRYGGYLIWHRYPEHTVSSDTRLTLRSDQFFKEYTSIIDTPALFDHYAMQWNITQVILPLAPIIYYHPLASYLYHHNKWQLVCTDGAEALFVSEKHTNETSISLNNVTDITAINTVLFNRYHRYPSIGEEARHYLARWCMVTGSYIGAETAVQQCPSLPCRLLLSSIKMKQGNMNEAETILLYEKGKHPRNKHIAMNLIYFYLNIGQQDKALTHLSILLKKYPFYRPARTLLHKLN